VTLEIKSPLVSRASCVTIFGPFPPDPVQACRTLATAQSLTSGFPRTRPITLDASSSQDLDEQVAAHDLVISLVPYMYHADVIRSAIKGKTNVVTTSYVSPAMRELEAAAKSAGIVVLNEVGVDPGIDHLYAIKTISEVHAKGGKACFCYISPLSCGKQSDVSQMKEFYSYCGGLPSPECAGNPLGFKFSWSPRGALLSQRNSASYLLQGRQVDIPAEDLMSVAKPYFVLDGYSFVAYPNRNSVPFREFYDIPEAHTVIRGSLRYEGNPQFVQALINLGWLDTETKHWLRPGMTWAEIQQRAIDAQDPSERYYKHCKSVELQSDLLTYFIHSSLITRIKELCKFPTERESDRIISGLRWMGLLSPSPAAVQDNLLDTLASQLSTLLSYQPGERDLVMLQHKFVIEWADGTSVSNPLSSNQASKPY